MASKPHSVVRIGSIESDENGNDLGDTVVVVNEDGSAHYYSWRSQDWITMGVVPDTPAYEEMLPKKK